MFIRMMEVMKMLCIRDVLITILNTLIELCDEKFIKDSSCIHLINPAKFNTTYLIRQKM